jgi:hypothetical protein
MPIVASKKNTTQRVVVPVLGLNYSFPSTVIDEKNSFPKNCRVFNGQLVAKPGHADYGSNTMSAPVIHLFEFIQDNLTRKLLRFSADKSEVYNTGTTAWDDITKSGTDWTGTEGTDFFSTATFNDKALITNGIDNIQQYTGSGLCTDLGGTPPKAKFIVSFNNYVVIAHVVDGGNTFATRVQWCNTAQETQWSTGNAGSIDLDDEPDPIIGMAVLNEFVIVYKQKHIYRLRLVDSVSVFNFDHVVSGVGLLNNRSLVSHNGVHYFISSDGNLCAFNGIRVESLGDEVRNQIFPRLNANRLETNFARKNEKNQEIQFFITIGGENWPTEVFKLNYENGAIMFDEVDGVTTSTPFRDTSGDETWDNDSDTWDSDTTRWDDILSGTGFEFDIIGKSDNGTYKESDGDKNDDGNAIDQEFQTSDFSFGAHENYKRWLRIDFQATGDSVDLFYSTDSGITWFPIPLNSTTTSFTLDGVYANYTGWFDAKGTYIRFRFKNNRVGESFQLRQFAIEGKVKELNYR